jgi:hypothetical protein
MQKLIRCANAYVKVTGSSLREAFLLLWGFALGMGRLTVLRWGRTLTFAPEKYARTHVDFNKFLIDF